MTKYHSINYYPEYRYTELFMLTLDRKSFSSYSLKDTYFRSIIRGEKYWLNQLLSVLYDERNQKKVDDYNIYFAYLKCIKAYIVDHQRIINFETFDLSQFIIKPCDYGIAI